MRQQPTSLCLWNRFPFSSRSRRAGGSRPRARRERGLSLIEIMLSITFFIVAALGSMTVMLSSMRLDATNRETALARQAARRMMERIKGTTFREIFATYNANANDDPLGTGSAPGATFAVRGVNPQAGLGAVGDIVFPTTGGVLCENVTLAALGMPRDLNGDNVIDGATRADDYYVLPVMVRVRWRGGSGDCTFVLATVIVE